MQFLSKVDCCKEEQLINFLDCSKEDILYLLNNKLILKKEDIIYSKIREKIFDIRYCIATELLSLYKGNIQSLKRGKYPVLIEFIVNGISCDVIVAKKLNKKVFLGIYIKYQMQIQLLWFSKTPHITKKTYILIRNV